MKFIDDKIKELLDKLPSETSNIDYKICPYQPNQKPNFLKDVIAMLNSEAAVGKEKFLIIGVSDDHKLIGIKPEQWKDDNEWQNLIDNIKPRPDVNTGTVDYNGKIYGYIYIPATNDEWVYEASKTIVTRENDPVKESNIIAKGQAFTRVGSKNEILSEKGRRHLLTKKVQRHYIPLSKINDEHNLLPLPLLIGSWNEKYPADIDAVEKLTGINFTDFTASIRNFKFSSPDIFVFSNGVWQIKNHAKNLLSVSAKIFDNHIDSLFQIINMCFIEIDTISENRKYSKEICTGLAETLAILGNNADKFANCSRNKIINSIYMFEQKFFSSKNWKLFATNADYFQHLGEACPDAFITQIMKLTSSADNAFTQFLKDREKFISGFCYNNRLGLAIANIAKVERYFPMAMSVLLRLAKIRPSFLDVLVEIVLPWYPQTHAPVTARVGVFKGLYKEDETLTWKALMQLMPKVISTVSPIQEPYFLKVEPIANEVSKTDYNEASLGYIELALNLVKNNVNRMIEMISVIENVGGDVQDKIIQRIKDNAITLSRRDKEKLWDKLEDFIIKHKKYSDCNWALSAKQLQKIINFSHWLIPNTTEVSSIRLFKDDQFLLHEKDSDYQGEEKRLRDEQTSVLKKIYEDGGIEKLLDFSNKVENKMLAGVCISDFLTDTDIKTIIFTSANIENDKFLHPIVIRIDTDRIIRIIDDADDIIKAKVISIYSLTEKIFFYVKCLSAEAQTKFWKQAQVFGSKFEKYTTIKNSVFSLNSVGRTDKSIFILYNHIVQNNIITVDPQLVVDTLKINIEICNSNYFDKYQIKTLIKWLQNNNCNEEAITLIEFKYLEILQEDDTFQPKHLWNKLSSDPDFFLETLKVIYNRNDVEKYQDENNSKLINQYFKLLFGWKQTPGLTYDGKFDERTFKKWIKIVNEKSKDSDIHYIAMNYFGQAAFHAPSDESGFFINFEVARSLQEDTSGGALSGFHTEAINSRGVYAVDPTGAAEFAIEADYRSKARTAVEHGLLKLSDELQKIADEYHDIGESHIEHCKRT